MIQVIGGTLTIKLQDRDLLINPGEFVIIPRGVEHCPVAANEVQLMLLEPKTTLNTGAVLRQTAAWHERTVEAEWI